MVSAEEVLQKSPSPDRRTHHRKPSTVQDAPVPGAAPLRPRRQPKWIVGGALSMLLGALGAAWLWHQATGTHQVVYVAQPLEVGQEITAGDLTTVSVGRIPHVQTVSGDELNALIGQEATVALPEGTLLPAGVIGDVPLDEGESQLGLRLASGRIPTTGLHPGSPVLAVTLPDPALVQPQAESLTTEAVIVADDEWADLTVTEARVITAPVRDEDGISWIVDVAVPDGAAADLARLAATDRVALVLDGE